MYSSHMMDGEGQAAAWQLLRNDFPHQCSNKDNVYVDTIVLHGYHHLHKVWVPDPSLVYARGSVASHISKPSSSDVNNRVIRTTPVFSPLATFSVSTLKSTQRPSFGG